METKLLGDICDVLDSKRKPITKCDRVPGAYPYYGATGIVDYVSSYIFDEKLVLVGEDGAKWAAGENTAFLVSGKTWVNNHAHVIRPHRDIVCDEWIVYYLTGNDLSEYVTGLTVPKLNQAQLRSIPIPLPPLPVQKAIVAKLDAAFASIEQAIAAAEKNAENAKRLFQIYLSDVFERGGEGWEEKHLKDIAEYFNGLTYSPKSVSENGTVVLRSSNIQNDEIDLSDIVRVDAKIKDKIYVRDGDILMCSRNGSRRLVGKTADIQSLPEAMTFGTFMMIVRSEHNSYLSWFFKSTSFREQITSGENTMINQITRYMLDEIKVWMPPVKERAVLVGKFNAISRSVKELDGIYVEKILQLSKLKQSLLQQAFNGQLVDA
jgi:type I restriction enzyme S subunit